MVMSSIKSIFYGLVERQQKRERVHRRKWALESIKWHIKSRKLESIEDMTLDAVEKAIESCPKHPYKGKDQIVLTWGGEFCAEFFDFFGDVEGKKILDIGCGFCNEHKKSEGDRYSPWKARILTFAGANVIGIDAEDSPNEPYKHIVADINNVKLTELLSDSEFDVAIATAFFNSPSGESLLYKNKMNRVDFNKKVCKEVYSLLKPCGIFLTSELQMSGATLYKNVYRRRKAERKGRKILKSVGFSKLGRINKSYSSVWDIWEKPCHQK